MKKNLLALLLGFTTAAMISNCVFAMNSENPVAFNSVKIFKSSVRNIAIQESFSDMGIYIPDVIKISAKAVRDFQVRFGNNVNVTWYSDKNGFVSYFVKDGFGERAYYDKKGNWQYSLLFYDEDKLPQDIRTTVRSTYFDLAITLVEEVQTPDGIGYIVHLEDKSSLINLKVSREGEMEIMQKFIKE
jgi:hypothetical protein